MADDTTQRAAFAFLREHLQSQKIFNIKEFISATGWAKPGTLNTYLRKQYKGLIENAAGTPLKVPAKGVPLDIPLRVTDAFWKFATWRRFKSHVTQVRRVVTNYEANESKILIYDFLMPLTNEEYLRMALDSLFYKDRVSARLRTIGSAVLKQGFAGVQGQADDEYFESLVEFIKSHLVGYSVYHVDGRYRSDKLLTQDQASALQKQGERYLFDETTAVTRFIFPYQSDAELKSIRYLFQVLFIRSIIQLVNGEEQIWMVESGTAGSKLHRWERLSDDADDEDDEDDGSDED
jgi:hypothetical protein